jgi:hypothetical protein
MDGLTEIIRIIEVRKCGECPHCYFTGVRHKCRKLDIYVIPDIVSPRCDLREMEVIKQSVIDNWEKVCKMYPGTGYDPDMIGPKPSNSME